VALFFQVFVSKARSATIVGYLLSIWVNTMTVSLNQLVYVDPQEMPLALRLFPPFAFSRLIYNISMSCSTGACYQSISDMSSEMKSSVIILYIGAILLIFGGIYLYEVVPQEHGTQKHWLFCLRSCRSRRFLFWKLPNEISQAQAEQPNVLLVEDPP
jgi:ABC-type anion transport system duplicated permease subunit